MSVAAALLLLYDDYKTWKEGGKSLIDWSKWEPDIIKAKAAIDWIIAHLTDLANHVGGWQRVAEGLAILHGEASGRPIWRRRS